MSIWGSGIADNDDAADWLDDFVDEPSITALNDALDEVLGSSASDYVEVTEGAAAVVAAQIVAELFFKAGEQPLLEDEEVFDVCSGLLNKLHPGSKRHLIERATQAVATVGYGAGTSELHDLMHEDPDLAQKWLQTIQGLQLRLLQAKEELNPPS